MSKTITFKPYEAILTIAVALLMAIEVLIICGIASYHIPFKVDPALADILFHYRKGFVPERELLLYGTGIMLAFICCLAAAYLLRNKFQDQKFMKDVLIYALMHGLIVIVEVGLVLAISLDPSKSTLWPWLYGLMVVSLLIKIFWIEIRRCFSWI